MTMTTLTVLTKRRMTMVMRIAQGASPHSWNHGGRHTRAEAPKRLATPTVALFVRPWLRLAIWHETCAGLDITCQPH